MIIISGAMVASLALPASALTPTGAMAPVGAVAIAAASPAQAPLAPRTFGKIDFTGVVKPKPTPKPVVVPVARPVVPAVSRSSTRTAPVAAPVAAPAPASGGVLGIAASLAGISYVYGGTTTAGFDCSGFTQYVFGKVGINLPRTSEAQQGAASSVSNPQPGDLVFFGSPAGHVGIYAGNGMMWDSPHSGSSVGLHAVYPGASYGRP